LYLSSADGESLNEDVIGWFDAYDIRHTATVKSTGKIDCGDCFDFVTSNFQRQPEQIIQKIDQASRDTAQTVVLWWINTKVVRPPRSRAYVLLIDDEQPDSSAVMHALRSYAVRPVPRSERKQEPEEVAA
jgi:hypothetical protein